MTHTYVSIYVSKTYLFGAKPLPELMLPNGQLDPDEHMLFKMQKFFIQEMHLNISYTKMAAILSRPQGDIYGFLAIDTYLPVIWKWLWYIMNKSYNHIIISSENPLNITTLY